MLHSFDLIQNKYSSVFIKANCKPVVVTLLLGFVCDYCSKGNEVLPA